MVETYCSQIEGTSREMSVAHLRFSVHGCDDPEFERVGRRLDERDDLVVRRPLDVVLVDPHDVVALLHARALQQHREHENATSLG